MITPEIIEREAIRLFELGTLHVREARGWGEPVAWAEITPAAQAGWRAVAEHVLQHGYTPPTARGASSVL